MDNYNPYSDPAYVQAKQASDTAYQQYGTAAQNTLTMPDMLKKALDQKFASQDNPLYKMQENTSKDYFNSLDTGYQDVLPENNNGMIFSPEAQQQQIQGKRNSLLALLSSVNQMIGGGFGGIENVIGEATKMYTAQEKAAQLKAETARQKVADLFEEISAKEAIRQFNEELKLKQQEANKPPAAAYKSPLEQMIEQEMARQFGLAGGGEDNVNMPTEPKPTSKPRTKSNRLYTSEQGQWMFDWGSNDWIPIMD